MTNQPQRAISNPDLQQISQQKSSRIFGEDVDPNFRPIRILVFRNGDEWDPGTEVNITRREFKHWIKFLESLTNKIKSRDAIHFLYNLEGVEMRHFKYLEDGGSYVAAPGKFKQTKYGKRRTKTWSIRQEIPESKPGMLADAEGMDIYLKKMGFASKTGRPFVELERIADQEEATKFQVKKDMQRTRAQRIRMAKGPIPYEEPKKPPSPERVIEKIEQEARRTRTEELMKLQERYGKVLTFDDINELRKEVPDAEHD